jgi:hypothetical protein
MNFKIKIQNELKIFQMTRIFLIDCSCNHRQLISKKKKIAILAEIFAIKIIIETSYKGKGPSILGCEHIHQQMLEQ